MYMKSSFFNFVSSSKILIISSVLFILFMIFVLPYFSNLSDQIVGPGSPDTNFFYDKEDLDSIAYEYGPSGRSNYIILRWTFDFLWPLVYFFFLVSSHLYLSKKLNFSFYKKLYFLPIISTLFDYIENISLSVYMALYPNTNSFLAVFASFASLMKWLLISLSFALIIIMFIHFSLNRLNFYNLYIKKEIMKYQKLFMT